MYTIKNNNLILKECARTDKISKSMIFMGVRI